MKTLITLLLVFLINFGITQCEDFSMTIENDDPLCIGLADGIITIHPEGGTAPFIIIKS